MTADAGTTPKDRVILACLTIIGVAYFGQYYDCGFNVADEGSTVLLSARLLDGERPFRDVVLGYGLLWYYPLVLLFKFTGVNFIAVRIYFICLALTTSLLAFLTIRKHTHRRGLAAVGALFVLLIPGTLHKAYLPLIVVANMWCLPAFSSGRALRGRQVLGAGLIAAISYHIRPDLGLIAVLVLAATLTTHAISQSKAWSVRIRLLARQWMLLAAAAAIPTLPLWAIARSQGFADRYWLELYQPVKFLIKFSQETLDTVLPVVLGIVRGAFYAPVAWAAPAASPAPTEAGKTLARIPWDTMWQAGPRQILAVLTYLPILALLISVIYALYLMLRRRLASRPIVTDDTVGILALVGLSCSAFPQFFLFRPDLAHLSQFMPGYVVLAAIAVGRWLIPFRQHLPTKSDMAPGRRRLNLLMRSAAIGLLISHLGLYVWFAFPRATTGSIALAKGRTERFHGAAGVDIAVTPWELKQFERVTRIVAANTDEHDVVLCFPYCPGFNVVTQRRTFTRRLYFDDRIPVLEPEWQQQTIHLIELTRVPLIIIRDWPPNGTEISRFKNWATDMMDHIGAGYELVDQFANVYFYRRASVQDGGTEQSLASPDGPERDFTWRSPAQSLFAARDSVHTLRAEPAAEPTDAYLRTLDAIELARQGADFRSRRFDLRLHTIGEQLAKSVDQLTYGRDYDFEQVEASERRLQGVDRERVLAAIFEQVTGDASSNKERHIALAKFLAKAIHPGPLAPIYPKHFSNAFIVGSRRALRVEDPLVLLELGEGGSDRVATTAVDLWRAAGMEARLVKLSRHVVAELSYDGGWHYLDALSFAGEEMVQTADGTVPSLAELSRTPLAIDRPASYVEPFAGGSVMTESPRYPSHQYFGSCPNCRPAYRYKTGTRRQQSRDLRFGWCRKLTRKVNAKDIVLSNLAARFQPGAPRFTGIDIGPPEDGSVTIEIRWRRSLDEDGDLVGYRVYVSRKSRGWSYNSDGASPEVLPYWSHPAGWDPSMYDHLFELPGSDVALVTTDIEHVRLNFELGDTYYVTVMPFDAHGEAVGRKLYRTSQELKLSL